jgi:molybdopterin-guanine dinucleotide biosynthesis protein A
VAHRALTGVLLVGGASRRFGSPKALASFRGRTLAERAWELLGEACDERLAVGKVADGLLLPFPVLDDGVDVRAPIAGVIAGLRAARHDVGVVVPVDCPLLTVGAVRALGAAGAVPQTGPLPGAYTAVMLPALEARLSTGELSLRGVNENVVELDPRLLANVNTPAELAALERPGHALVVGGTGMLAGLTTALAERGHSVTVVARSGAALPRGAVQLAVDYRDDRTLAEGLAAAVAERGEIELAVAWIHTDAPAAPATVAGAVAPGGRLVQVFGTRVWPLQPVPPHVSYRRVLLGSIGDRWLTDDEIAAGVLDAIDTDEPLAVVGERDPSVGQS